MRRLHRHETLEEWRACHSCSQEPDDTLAWLGGMLVVVLVLGAVGRGLWCLMGHQ